jgi:hypothetical protein
VTSVLEEIEKERARWMAKCGEPPKRLYVGLWQHKNLKALAEKFCVFRGDGTAVPKRMKYDGMEVFLVDEANYIDFGWDGPAPSPAG